ncbi:Intradiol ring-cleavage dioxygenase [Leptodontidium sp. MPI-SDFR-AT-0119]|nr:Intradiol ring-cleavage dioxygenase [Leptodontidium sp. MPI-SDFR-AT-0119]
MVYLSKAFQFAATATLLSHAFAHQGHDLTQEIAERNAFYKTAKRDLSHCDVTLRKRGTHARQQERREAAIAKARAARGLPQKRNVAKRDATDVSHLSSLDVTPTTSGVEDIIFANSTCLLSPEGEEGPYYVKGEYIRSDISEDQPGVEVIWDLQFINAETCEPIENLTSDIWHCNATGVYAGVIATGNGNTADTSNIDKTFLRGLQTTDSEGVVQYTSIFPGYYSGRATHVHVETHLNGTVLPNGTYTGGSIAHIGQFFFDQDLITEVNALSPYSENTNTITENADDRVVSAELENDADPFLNYVLLGDSVSDGLFMWVTLSVNPSASYTSSPASELTADGGVAVSSSSSGPSGVNGGNGTMMGNALKAQVQARAAQISRLNAGLDELRARLPWLPLKTFNLFPKLLPELRNRI